MITLSKDSFSKLSFIKKIKTVIKNFSATERTIFGVLALTLVISGYITLTSYLDNNFKVTIPEEGGQLIEGAIGTPRFINPLLANSETDRDLTDLIYSGLMRENSKGEMELDLADSLDISEDGLVYTFTISDKAFFHDGRPVMADDVIFTINKAEDPELKSVKRSDWDGVLINRIDDKTVQFTLSKPYEPFLKNTVLGILPRHIWEGISSTEFAFSIYNANPIGSGPYKIKKVDRDSIGIPTIYILEKNTDFILGEPFIKEIIFKFAKNEDELIEMYKNGQVESVHGISPSKAKELGELHYEIKTASLPRQFGIFLNQNQSSVLASKAVRQALSIAAPRNKIVDEVLFGFGEAIDSPIPKILDSENENKLISENLTEEQRIAEAIAILEKAGWEKSENGIYIFEDEENKKMLSFSIATSNVPELVEAANKTVEAWKKIGADVDVKVYDPNDFNQNIIRQRNYDAILFGIVVGKISDLYAFWHSSQRNDPGLNISGYANIKTDELLEGLRTLSKGDSVREDILTVESEIKNDVPAIFLYSPQFIYVMPQKVQGVTIENLITADQRFNEVYKWFIKTDKVLEVFQ